MLSIKQQLNIEIDQQNLVLNGHGGLLFLQNIPDMPLSSILPGETILLNRINNL